MVIVIYIFKYACSNQQGYIFFSLNEIFTIRNHNAIFIIIFRKKFHIHLNSVWLMNKSNSFWNTSTFLNTNEIGYTTQVHL